mmetsp:Transcript_84017/g.261017  ORF Transcript_84017/g.261017 Transcript_84017/m.261017 type:complete len:435 (-) Transcript_84017:41-1345(-)
MEQSLDWEPYHYNGRRRRRGPGRSFYDWTPEASTMPKIGGRNYRTPDLKSMLAQQIARQPLISAITKNDMLNAQGIVMAKADLNEDRDECGRTALHLASKCGFAGLVRLLAEHSADLSARVAGEAPVTAVHLSVYFGHNAVLRVLLDARADPNARGEGLEPPLGRCAGDGNLEAIRLLLKARALVDLQEGDVEGRQEASPAAFSALLRAAERNADRAIVEDLVSAGADLNAADAELNRPLHVAVRKGNLRVARCLLDALADPNCCNRELTTPLHTAVVTGEARAISLLVQYHGDLQLQDIEGSTPMDLAAGDMLTRQLLCKMADKTPLARASSTPAVAPASPSAGRRPPRLKLSTCQLLTRPAGGLAKACPPTEFQLSLLKPVQAPQAPLSGRSLAGSSSAGALPSSRASTPSSTSRRPRHGHQARRSPPVAWG